jgi:DNA-binding transcriptional ArsR family regulator
MRNKSYNNFFMNFASNSRFGIIMALRAGPLSVSDIVSRTGEEQSAVSHNLARLSGCHILKVRQRGKQRLYSLNRDTVIPMLDIVERHVRRHCPGGCDK